MKTSYFPSEHPGRCCRLFSSGSRLRRRCRCAEHFHGSYYHTRNDSCRAHPEAFLYKAGRRNVAIHDPSAIIKCKDEYWIFYTGNRSYRSKDMVKT